MHANDNTIPPTPTGRNNTCTKPMRLMLTNTATTTPIASLGASTGPALTLDGRYPGAEEGSTMRPEPGST
jgi:hypothetical protein